MKSLLSVSVLLLSLMASPLKADVIAGSDLGCAWNHISGSLFPPKYTCGSAAAPATGPLPAGWCATSCVRVRTSPFSSKCGCTPTPVASGGQAGAAAGMVPTSADTGNSQQ